MEKIHSDPPSHSSFLSMFLLWEEVWGVNFAAMLSLITVQLQICDKSVVQIRFKWPVLCPPDSVKGVVIF